MQVIRDEKQYGKQLGKFEYPKLALTQDDLIKWKMEQIQH